MNEVTTAPSPRVARSPGVGRVAFLFGLTGRQRLSGAVLRRLLADLGVAPAAARSTLARMVRAGQLTSHREGRTTSYAMAGAFAAGFERVRGQDMTRPVPWPGHFHALLYSVPEQDRAFRDQFRRAATFAGYGVLQPGLLIALADRSDALAELVAAAPSAARIRTATLGMTTDQATAAAAAAWDLPGLAQTYRDHIDRLITAAAAGTTGPPSLRAYAEIYQPALSDTLKEPALDPVLLPPDWPGRRLRDAFTAFEAAHAPLVERYRDELFVRPDGEVGEGGGTGSGGELGLIPHPTVGP